MATVNPSVVTAYNDLGQNFYTTTFPGENLYPNPIVSVSKANPAVVTTSSPTTISTTGTVETIAGSGPYTAVISGMTTTQGILPGTIITATAGTGNLGVGTTSVSSIIGNDSIGITSSATQNAGTITNIQIPAKITLPAGMVDGTPVLITNVGGMTQLATAGADNTNLFYANVISSTSFSLYTNANLASGVNSTGFTTATANTGQFTTFTVPELTSVGIFAPIIFPTEQTNVGTDIELDLDTGIFTLQSDITYTIVAQTQPKNNAFNGNYIVLVNVDTDEVVGPPAPIDGTFTITVTPSVDTSYQFYAVRPDEQPWTPPSGVRYATLTVTAASGFEA